MNNLSPELIAYAKAIVKKRGIAQKDMAPCIMHDVLKEAVRKMGEAIEKFEAVHSGLNARKIFWNSLYNNTIIS